MPCLAQRAQSSSNEMLPTERRVLLRSVDLRDTSGL